MTDANTTVQEQTMTNQREQMIANKPEEQLLAEIMNMQRQNPTAKKAEKLCHLRINFSICFVRFAYAFYGLDRKQLETYTPEKLKILSKLILTKAKPRAKLEILFGFVPILGWIYLATRFTNFNYCRIYKKLQKMCGEDFICHEILNKAINGEYDYDGY
ncbi:MAG: hypothetical protein HYT61_02260 [Candidatus Yanofskybacteria bacterium]|nr:hypothetical protein [Candidatus Yanofskybacteria bacterium]